MSADKIRYYDSFDQDFVLTARQQYQLPPDYEWIKTGIKAKIMSCLTYALAYIFGGLYCRLVLRVRFVNKKVLKQIKSGCFVYGNHTQPFGDVIVPALALFPKRIYTLCSPSNLGLSVIGKYLSHLGALPIPATVSGIKKLNSAIETRVNAGGCIIIYPEAHVWEYYTKIRPFSETSFLYPVKSKKPCFCMTAVYKKSRLLKRPAMKVYFDGPFYPDQTLKPREQAKQLWGIVYEKMQERSRQSDCEYIKYEEVNQ